MGFHGDMYIWKDRKRFWGMPLSFTRYALSEDRLFFSVGFFSVRDEEVLLYRVRDLSVKRNLWQLICGVGTIKVTSADKSTPELVLKNVKHPTDVKEQLHETVENVVLFCCLCLIDMMSEEHDEMGDDEFDGVPDAT